MNIQLTDVVKHLLIINVIVFFAASSFLDPRQLYLYYPGSRPFEPYQMISHMFMHGGVSHLAFNMFSLFFLGPHVERFLGGQKFLVLYLAAGFGAMFAHLAFMMITGDKVPVVGASGAVYGVLVGFATLFPNVKLQLLFPPIPIMAKYLALGLIVFDLYSGITGRASGVAHFAHLGGALIGYLIVIYWRRNP